MERGEVWVGVWPNDPENKPRPLLVVSNNLRNKANNILDVIVVKLTSLERPDGTYKKTNEAEDVIHTFKKPTIIRCGQVYTVEKKYLTNKIDKLTFAVIKKVDTCLKIVLNL